MDDAIPRDERERPLGRKEDIRRIERGWLALGWSRDAFSAGE